MYFPDLLLVKSGIEKMCHIVLAAIASYQVDLVFHERDQGANDNGHSFAHHGRKLITKAFSSSCGHDHECVFSQ